MRYEYVQPFVSSAQHVLECVLDGRIRAGRVRLSPAPMSSRGVTAIVGVTGENEGRVLFDMAPDTALAIASEMNEEDGADLSPLAKDTLSELASMMIGRAVSVLNDRGHQFEVSPPTLVAGENVTISNSELETMVVPLETVHGDVFVSVAMATV